MLIYMCKLCRKEYGSRLHAVDHLDHFHNVDRTRAVRFIYKLYLNHAQQEQADKVETLATGPTP